MSVRFYVNSSLQPGPLVLQGPEAHHMAVVCRLRPGDQVCLFNGDGHEYLALVRSAERRCVELVVQEGTSPRRELPFRIEVAAPLPKSDRGQILIEKLTELGVSAFVPLQTERSVVHPPTGTKLERWVIEASKQCGRNVLMRIEPLAEWGNYCSRSDLPANRVIAHPGSPSGTRFAGRECSLAIGPEGGFTDAEVEWARSHGWQTIGLGERTLRIETAAIVLAAWVIAPGS